MLQDRLGSRKAFLLVNNNYGEKNNYISMGYAALRLTLLALATAPLWLAYAQLQHPTPGSTIRAAILATLSATLVYLLAVKRWPTHVDSEGNGIAGLWGLAVECRLYDQPLQNPHILYEDGVVAVQNLGYETLACVYKHYMFKRPETRLEAEPLFKVGRPAPIYALKRPPRLGTVVLDPKTGWAAYYPPGTTKTRFPKPLPRPRTDNPYLELQLAGTVEQARDLALRLLDSARLKPDFGGLRVGVDEYGCVVTLPDHHLGVWGATRSGKTTLLLNLAAGEDGDVWVIDFFGEYRPLSGHGFEVVDRFPDPIAGLRPEEAVALLDTTVKLVFGEGLTPIQYTKLYEILKRAGGRGVGAVIERIVEESEDTTYREEERNAYKALYWRLLPLSFADWSGWPGWPGRVVFDLSRLDDVSKVLVSNMVLSRAYRRGGLALVIDEAHRLARRTWRGDVVMPVLADLVREAGALGVRIVVADQNPGEIPHVIVDQLVNMYLRYPKPPVAVPEEIRRLITTLRLGEALLYNASIYRVRLDPPRIRPSPKKVFDTNILALSELAEKVSLEEIEAYLRGEADRETLGKLKSLGVSKGSRRLTRLGRALYEYLRRREE